jgi:DNA-binding transcriptional regulator/RsmH inhibitor MraZ
VSISDDQKYLGFFPYKMDPKFRVSIPVSWRPETGATLLLLFSKTHKMPMIKVLTREAYNARVQIVKESDLTPAEKMAKLGTLAMLCREASVNDQGKLLIPKDLSEKAEITADSEVSLVGRGMHFEVWKPASFERMLEIEQPPEDGDGLGIF